MIKGGGYEMNTLRKCRNIQIFFFYVDNTRIFSFPWELKLITLRLFSEGFSFLFPRLFPTTFHSGFSHFFFFTCTHGHLLPNHNTRNNQEALILLANKFPSVPRTLSEKST